MRKVQTIVYFAVISCLSFAFIGMYIGYKAAIADNKMSAEKTASEDALLPGAR